MPLYHFNLIDGTDVPDVTGQELANLDAAKDQAIRLSGALISELGPEFWSGHEWRLEVTDDVGLILFSLTFFGSLSAAVTPHVMG